jgi:hypothetical protein
MSTEKFSEMLAYCLKVMWLETQDFISYEVTDSMVQSPSLKANNLSP